MNGSFVIAQLSDIHCGDPRYDRVLADNCIRMITDMKPDLVLVPGDLTAAGYREEFEEASTLLERLPSPKFVVPGNHDERNVGWRVYQRLFGKRWHTHTIPLPHGRLPYDVIRLVACDSAEPDLDDGELGRVRHGWIREGFRDAGRSYKIVMLHHHLIAVPNTGRERNTVADAGDVLETLSDVGVDLVLSGHKHVPHVWSVNGMAVVTSGTASTWRIRGEVVPSFNRIEIGPEGATVDVVSSADGGHLRLPLPVLD